MDVATAARSVSRCPSFRLSPSLNQQNIDAKFAEKLSTLAVCGLHGSAGDQRGLYNVAIFGKLARIEHLERRTEHFEKSEERSVPHSATSGLKIVV